uniref:Uncharacterized protein n=1 Tax=Avena sativa TaxID=4498 RepID=A0ACD5XU33_AVESA
MDESSTRELIASHTSKHSNRSAIVGGSDRASRARTTTTTTMMPRTTGIWLMLIMATVCLAATVARAYDETAGDVNTYWQTRTQETRFKRGGPLNDIVNAASRYHQELNGKTFDGGRYLLQEQEQAAEGPVAPTGAADDAGVAAPPAHNTLADHEMI